MTRRQTILLGVLGAALLLLLASAGYGFHRWQLFKQQQHIVALDIEGLRLSWSGLYMKRIALARRTAQGEQLDIELHATQLDLDAWWRPLPLASLEMERLDLSWHPAPDATELYTDDRSNKLPTRDELQRWASWLPRHGRVATFNLTLPCLRGRCDQPGELQWQHPGDPAEPIQLSLHLLRDDHRLTLDAVARHDHAESLLDLQLLLDNQLRLEARQRFEPVEDSTLWEGSLALGELPEAPWLLAWLSDWLVVQTPAPDELPQQMRLGASWSVHLITDQLLSNWQAQRGELRVSADLPGPWPILGLGELQGRLDLSAKGDNRRWAPTDVAADLHLLPAPALVDELPAALRPAALHLLVKPGSASELTNQLPLRLQLTAEGPSAAMLDAQLSVDTTAPYTLHLAEARARLSSPSLQLAELRLQGLEADLRFHGEAGAQTAQLRLDDGSRVVLNSLAASDNFSADQLQLNLAGLSLEADITDSAMQRLHASGPAALTIRQLKQPTLRSLGWHWRGQLVSDLRQLVLQGPLTNDAELALDLQLTHDWVESNTHLSARLPEIFLRAGNPLASTLTDWPPLLELNTGRLQAQAELALPANGALAAEATLDARGLGGIYDRTELSGLDASLALTLQGERLQLRIPELTLSQANPGFSFGPISLRGDYLGDLQQIAQGRLNWQTAEARLLGGRLWLDPGSADLASAEQSLNAHLRGLQLPLLLEAYPTEGLSGTGVIDGELQLQRSEQGLSVENGTLQAREPGGVLRFRSAKMQALGQSNPAMRLVVEALDDFHYDRLSSDVHYATDGKLDLGLKLNGRNPALEGGRPINLTVNLQEDIPALLTSLQLSDRVSETIRRRVQERLE